MGKSNLSAEVPALIDADWAELQRLSGLPDDAREAVAEIIEFLRAKPSLQHPRKRSVCRPARSLIRRQKSVCQTPSKLWTV
jgi:hypothetical protein